MQAEGDSTHARCDASPTGPTSFKLLVYVLDMGARRELAQRLLAEGPECVLVN